MRLLRLFAQMIDWLVSIAALVFSFLFLLPLLKQLMPSTTVCAVVTLITAILLAVAVQIPFLSVNQTVGKAFFGLEIQSCKEDRPLTQSIIMQREIFCKLFSCYLICIPMIFGKPGGHEAATETRVVRRRKNTACYKK
ncbi:RDD family protein [Clostridium merdae]|uniref:RDD family protein n=1 Tax=Clostridium merdae TaxID=1958780 RepID=UPI000A268B0D|nr:RDD family protein [Clostridium merdae]